MGFLAPALQFAGAVLFGTGLSGATAGYIFAVNVARVGLLALTAKLTAPKLDLTQTAVEKTLTVRDPIAPQQIIYGQDLVSGPIIYTNVAGNENRNLFMAIGFAGHEIDSIQEYRLDDYRLPLGLLSGAEDGTIAGGPFGGVASVQLRKGTLTQTAPSKLTGAFPGLFTAAHTGRGWSYMVWEFNLIEGEEDKFSNGAPRNIRALVRGRKLYDPRLDSTNGGAGAHRLGDPGTWEWSENPALCLADFIKDQKFGMREETDRIDWPLVIAAANICDELVDIPGAATQKRYTCNTTFVGTETRGAVRDELLGAMLGRMVFSQGRWKMWAGAALTPDVTLTASELNGGISVQVSSPSSERNNRVRGKFVDADRDYVAQPYPEQRSTTFEIQDGSEVRELVADFTSTTNNFEAQRKAIVQLKQTRNQRVVVFEGNLKCFRVQPGTTVLLDIPELGFSSEKFFVSQWRFGENGINLTLVEEDDSVWADPLPGDYVERTSTGVLVFGETGAPAPTGFTAQRLQEGALLQWTNPVSTLFREVEVWRAFVNDRAQAEKIATTTSDRYFDDVEPTRFRYYWIRAVNRYGVASAWNPTSATGGVQVTPSSINPSLTLDPDFDLSTSLDPADSEYWNEVVKQGGGTVLQVGSVTFNPSGGANNSKYVSLVLSASVTGNNAGSFGVQTKARVRANAFGFEFVFRYRTNGVMSGFPTAYLEARVSGYSAEEGGTSVAFGNEIQTLADSAGAWAIGRINVEVSGADLAQFYDFELTYVGDSTLNPTVDIDSLFVYNAIPEFGSSPTTGDGDNPPGIVPKNNIPTDSQKFLRGDGTWADPPGAGGGGNIVDGTTLNALARWDGSNWVEVSNALLASTGRLTINEGADSRIWLQESGINTLLLQATAGEARVHGVGAIPLGFYTNGTRQGQFTVAGNLEIAQNLTLVAGRFITQDIGGVDRSILGNSAGNTFVANDNAPTVLRGSSLTINPAVTTAPRLHLTAPDDVTLASTNDPFRIGPTAGQNVAFDSNEIQARNNGAAASLSINILGGLTSFGAGGIQSTGNINAVGGANVRVQDGGVLRAFDAGDVDYIDVRHDGNVGRVEQFGGGGLYMFTEGVNALQMFTTSVQLPDAISLNIFGAGNVSSFRQRVIENIGNPYFDMFGLGSGTGQLRIWFGATNLLDLLGGMNIRIRDAAGTSYMNAGHDGTYFNQVATSTTGVLWEGAQYYRFRSDGTAYSPGSAEADLGVIAISNQSLAQGLGVEGQGIDFLKIGSGIAKKASITPYQFGSDNDSMGLRFRVSMSGVGIDPISPAMDLVSGSAPQARVYATDGNFVFIRHDTSFGIIGTDAGTMYLQPASTNVLEVSTVSVRVMQGKTLRMDGTAGLAAYSDWRHNDVDLITSFFNTTSWEIEMNGLSTAVGFTEGAAYKVQVDKVGDRLSLRDGYSLRVFDASDTDYIDISHDGTSAIADCVNTSQLLFQFGGVTQAQITSGGDYIGSGYAQVGEYLQTVGASSGATTVFLDSGLNYTSGTLFLPLVRWRDQAGNTRAAIRGYMVDANQGRLEFLAANTAGTTVTAGQVGRGYGPYWFGGGQSRQYDSTGADYLATFHNGVDGFIDTNAGVLRIRPATGVTYFFESGFDNEIRVYDDAGLNYVELSMEGADAILNFQSGGTGRIRNSGATYIEIVPNRAATGATSGAKLVDHAGTLYDIGFNLLPVSRRNPGNFTLAAQDCGKSIVKDNTTAFAVTLPSGSGNVDFPVGGVTQIVNKGSTADIDIQATLSDDVVYMDGGITDIGASGTLSPGGIITIQRLGNNEYIIYGIGFEPL